MIPEIVAAVAAVALLVSVWRLAAHLERQQNAAAMGRTGRAARYAAEVLEHAATVVAGISEEREALEAECSALRERCRWLAEALEASEEARRRHAAEGASSGRGETAADRRAQREFRP